MNIAQTDRPSSANAAGQPSIPIWCGLTAGNWIKLLRLGPTIEWKYWKRFALVSLASVFNSSFSLVDRATVGCRAVRIDLNRPPVFILGHWRSGTTLLHTLMSRDAQFVAPNLYQCFFPHHFLLSERWLAPVLARFLPTTRPMDEMPQSWISPAEDEFALLLLTLASPYLSAAFPDQPQKVASQNNLKTGLTAAQLECWKSAFSGFLKRVALNRDQTLLLKSPAHTSRVPLLLELFPEARFIHLVRNPYDVFASMLHLQRVLTRDNAFTSEEPADLEERTLTNYMAMYQSYHLYRVKIPPQRRYELRFEDLVADPVGELQKIYGHLGLDGTEQLPDLLKSDIQQHLAYRRNKYALSEDARRKIAERWETVFLRYGYPIEPAEESSISGTADVTPS